MRFASSWSSWKTVGRSLTFEECDERLRAGWYVDQRLLCKAQTRVNYKPPFDVTGPRAAQELAGPSCIDREFFLFAGR